MPLLLESSVFLEVNYIVLFRVQGAPISDGFYILQEVANTCYIISRRFGDFRTSSETTRYTRTSSLEYLFNPNE